MFRDDDEALRARLRALDAQLEGQLISHERDKLRKELKKAEEAAADRVNLIKLKSIPQGAMVLDPEGKVLGRTPLQLYLPVEKQEIYLTLRLEGHQEHRVSVTLSKDQKPRVMTYRLAPSGQ